MKKTFVFIFILLNFSIFAQKKQDTVKTEVVEVVKSFTPQVQDAFKLSVNPDSIHVVEKKIPVEISIRSVPVASTFQPEKGSMSHFKFGKNYQKFPESYALMGIGNYWHFRTQSFLSYKVTDKLESGFFLDHFSTQGKKEDPLLNPAYNTQADVLLNYKNEKNKWLIDMGYLSKINYLNPNLLLYVPEPYVSYAIFDDLRKNNFFHLSLEGILKESLLNKIQFGLTSFWDPYSNSENKIAFTSGFVIPIGDFDIKTRLKSDLVAGNIQIPYSDKTLKISYTNFDLGILPAFTYTSNNLEMNLGAKIFYQNHDDFNNIQVLPDIRLDLGLIYETLNAFAGLEGDLIQHSFIDLNKKNPYLVPQEMKPALKPLDIYGGIKGNFSSTFAYELRMGYRKWDNYAFFNRIYSPIYRAYGILYDDFTQSYFASSIQIGIGNKLDFKLNFEYDQNNPDTLTKAPFLPDYKVKALVFFRPNEKWSLNMTLFNEGSRPGEYYSLDAYTDLNLEVFYKVTDRFTAFLTGNNLLNKTYEIYSGYPVEKMQIMGGIMYKFDIQ